MHVRKFEADTMDEALKAIKYELGPDAIIIKTVTNSGVKSAFKKKKIEITAAISEDDFNKKRKIDNLLNEDQKKELYSKPSHSINEVMNQYGKKNTYATSPAESSPSGYGKMALNKSVQQQKDIPQEKLQVSRSQSAADFDLDSFLAQPEKSTASDEFEMKKFHQTEVKPKISQDHSDSDYWGLKQRVEEQDSYLAKMKDEMEMLKLKLEDVGVNHMSDDSSDMLKQMYTTLKTFDIDQILLKSLMQSVRDAYHDEISEDELWAVAIEKIKSLIKIKSLTILNSDKPMLSVFISEGASGQTSLIYKVASKVKRVKLITYTTTTTNQDIQDKYLEKIIGLEVLVVNKPSELITAVKETLNEDCYPIVDMKIRGQDYNNIRSIFSALRKSFSNVEVIGCLSAIHSELYNKKFLHQVHRDVDYVCFTHTDLCINWVTMMNVHCHFPQVPLAALSTGPMIPQDMSEVSLEEFIKNMFGL
jgi:flagellar biosynthesis protein FlhF